MRPIAVPSDRAVFCPAGRRARVTSILGSSGPDTEYTTRLRPDAGAEFFLQFDCFARHRNKGPARLFAGKHGRRMLQAVRGFDHVLCKNAFVVQFRLLS